MIDTQSIPNDLTLEAGCCAPQVVLPLSSAAAQQVADDLQLIAHPIRLQILALLSQCADQLCVCDIEESLPIKQPTVSHHLRLLREAGLIEGEKRGLYVHYVVNQDAVQGLWQRVQSAMTGII
jgi:ArsR family transcriptional regulator, arsenate/arsenite/antimonite-responsive transcriptional repressor